MQESFALEKDSMPLSWRITWSLRICTTRNTFRTFAFGVKCSRWREMTTMSSKHVREFQQRCRNASPGRSLFSCFHYFQLPYLSSGKDSIVERLVTSPMLAAYVVCHLSLFINLALISAPPWDVERICKRTYEDLL